MSWASWRPARPTLASSAGPGGSIWLAVDIDELIERSRAAIGQPISSRATGSRVFPCAVERAVLLDQLPPRHLVVATGGGTFVDASNRAAINGDGLSIWLDAPLDRVIARLPSDGRRALAADRPTFERRYQQRRAAYQFAHVRLDAGRASVDALVEQVMDRLDS